jgi:hypothetical protein
LAKQLNIAAYLGQDGSLAFNALAANLTTQALGKATGWQEHFSWRNAAVAALAAPVAAEVTNFVEGAPTGTTDVLGNPERSGTVYSSRWVGDFGARLTSAFVSGVANQEISRWVTGSGDLNYANIAANAFGTTLGNSFVEDLAKAARMQTAVPASTPSSALGVGLTATPEQVAAAWGSQFGQTSAASPSLSDATESRVQRGETMLDFGDPYAAAGDQSADSSAAVRKAIAAGLLPGDTKTGLLIDPSTGLPSFRYTSEMSRKLDDAEQQWLQNKQFEQYKANAPSLTEGTGREAAEQTQATLNKMGFFLGAPQAAVLGVGVAAAPAAELWAGLPALAQKSVIGAGISTNIYFLLNGNEATPAGTAVAVLGGGLGGGMRYGMNVASGVEDYSLWTAMSTRTLPSLTQFVNLSTANGFYGFVLVGQINRLGVTSTGKSWWTSPYDPMTPYDKLPK